MADITVALITDLRNRTNAGMMDCKKALIDTRGDMDAAIKMLREKGLAIQVKRADKEAKQGIIKCAVAPAGKVMALAEINCETDFVAKTDGFKTFADAVVANVLAGDANVAETMKDDVVAIVSATSRTSTWAARSASWWRLAAARARRWTNRPLPSSSTIWPCRWPPPLRAGYATAKCRRM
jgi:translation elongation factor Ts